MFGNILLQKIAGNGISIEDVIKRQKHFDKREFSMAKLDKAKAEADMAKVKLKKMEFDVTKMYKSMDDISDQIDEGSQQLEQEREQQPVQKQSAFRAPNSKVGDGGVTNNQFGGVFGIKNITQDAIHQKVKDLQPTLGSKTKDAEIKAPGFDALFGSK